MFFDVDLTHAKIVHNRRNGYPSVYDRLAKMRCEVTDFTIRKVKYPPAYTYEWADVVKGTFVDALGKPVLTMWVNKAILKNFRVPEKKTLDEPKSV